MNLVDALSLDGKTLLRLLRAGGVPPWYVKLFHWYEDDHGQRFPLWGPDLAKVRGLAILQTQALSRAKAALEGAGYILVDQPLHEGRYPAFIVLAE